MSATFTRIKNWVAEVLTYSDLNAEFDNILTNFTPAGMDDASADVSAMDATTDPYPGATPSLATDLLGELKRIRYLLAQITGESKWYIDPDISLASLASTYQPLDATLTALAALTLTQGGLFTATGSDAPAILAKGTANQKLIMNAGATSPEWANPFYMGTFTRDATSSSADISYDGVGFKPSVVLFINGVSGSTNWSVGFDNASSHYCIAGLSSGTVSPDTSYSISINDGTNKQRGIIKTMDSDGFTITWTKTASPTGTMYVMYLAFR